VAVYLIVIVIVISYDDAVGQVDGVKIDKVRVDLMSEFGSTESKGKWKMELEEDEKEE
jgi:hypothetical protein